MARKTEEIEKRLVFGTNHKLNIKGEGYEVKEEKEIHQKNKEHVKTTAPLLKVINVRFHLHSILILYQKCHTITIYFCRRSSIYRLKSTGILMTKVT